MIMPKLRGKGQKVYIPQEKQSQVFDEDATWDTSIPHKTTCVQIPAAPLTPASCQGIPREAAVEAQVIESPP